MRLDARKPVIKACDVITLSYVHALTMSVYIGENVRASQNIQRLKWISYSLLGSNNLVVYIFGLKLSCGEKIVVCIYTEGYSESTEPIDAVNILPLARFEPTTLATTPSTTPDADATNCTTETSQKKDAQEALILTTTNAVHVVFGSFSMDCIYFVRK